MIGEVIGCSVAVGMGVQHAAYILQYGSIFEPGREWLRCKPDNIICRKLREMIMCQLCCITQLTLWCVVLPLSPIVWQRLGWLALPALFVGWMAQAAIGLAVWDVMRFIARTSDALVRRAQGRQPYVPKG